MKNVCFLTELELKKKKQRAVKSTYFIHFGIIWSLSIFCLFNVFHHFSDKCMTIILIFSHQYFQYEPQASKGKKKFFIKLQMKASFENTIYFGMDSSTKQFGF